jgi:asparagine synthase (glutamine-hydrolysing)
LPRTVYDRKKQGFTLPWEQWMKTDLKDFCDIKINNLSVRLDSPYLQKEWQLYLKGKSTISWARFWAAVALEDWLEKIQIQVN